MAASGVDVHGTAGTPMSQIPQILGALLLLAAFVSAQAGLVDDTKVSYLACNAVGSGILAAIAYSDRNWGFLLLEGTWAFVSTISLGQQGFRVRKARSSMTVDGAAPTELPGELSLRQSRAVTLIGDELSNPHRLIRLLRNSYATSQGRQWLQPHVIWWVLTFLRDNGIRADFDTLTAPGLRRKIIEMPLPVGHGPVEPEEHTRQNFDLWWSILIDIARTVYKPQWRRMLSGRATNLPDYAELRRRATGLGIQPWMSSATYEELSAIAHSLAVIGAYSRRGRVGSDKIMTDVLLPELLLAEMQWLKLPNGRPVVGGRPSVDIVLLRRYATVARRWADDRYLDPYDHMYLCAGDILDNLSRDRTSPSAVGSILHMYDTICRADGAPLTSDRLQLSPSSPIVTARTSSRSDR
ncbi:CBU_0592 family membrane protein [Nocardia sp. KC 131]|uniref:CBU_0592 family membrane protein n=1 Tax=Nocardia arseniciresistens TaxID=3392119 RepID=UPI00398EA616